MSAEILDACCPAVPNTEPAYEEWDLPEETVRLMVSVGFAHKVDGFYEFTEAGKKWIHAYCERVLEEHRKRGGVS